MNPIWLRIIDFLLGILGVFLAEAIKKLADKDVVDRLAKIALGHVQTLASSDMTNKQKRNAAFDAIKEDCEKLGVEAGDWLINCVIEIAVGKMKAERKIVELKARLAAK